MHPCECNIPLYLQDHFAFNEIGLTCRQPNPLNKTKLYVGFTAALTKAKKIQLIKR